MSKGNRRLQFAWSPWKGKKKFPQNLTVYKTHCSPLYIQSYVLGAIPGAILKPGCVSCKKNEDTAVFVSHPESTILPDTYVNCISPLLHASKKARENLAQSESILGTGKSEKN